MDGGTRRVVLAAVVACALAGVATPSATAQSGGFAPGQVDADDVLLQVDVDEDGDARWTVEYRLRLDDENASAAFRTLADDVAANPGNFTDRFGGRMAETARAAEDATGREMTIRNVSVRTERRTLPQEYGVVVYTFEWTNFAAVDGREIRAGDALGGLFLDGESSLVVTWPEGYELRETRPPADETRERSAVWNGPVDFGPAEPRVVVGPPGVVSALPLVAGGVAIVAVLVGVLVWRRRPDGTDPDDEPGTDDPAAAEAAADDESTADDDPPEPPDELLSNEERVLRVIERNGGRMKQQEVVRALDWTDAKTSQVVRDLREEGELDGFRLGRENVLQLPDEEG